MGYWNLQPLTIAEIMQVGDALHCPTCKKPRYVMWKAKYGSFYPVLMPMTGYCSCEEKREEEVNV